jgi:hypothetical protein
MYEKHFILAEPFQEGEPTQRAGVGQFRMWRSKGLPTQKTRGRYDSKPRSN